MCPLSGSCRGAIVRSEAVAIRTDEPESGLQSLEPVPVSQYYDENGGASELCIVRAPNLSAAFGDCHAPVKLPQMSETGRRVVVLACAAPGLIPVADAYYERAFYDSLARREAIDVSYRVASVEPVRQRKRFAGSSVVAVAVAGLSLFRKSNR
jgi:hypothetical protein